MPGKGRPFPKGASGNQGGRPKVLGSHGTDKDRRPNPNKRVPHTSGVKKERTTKSIDAYRKAKLDLVRDIIQTDHIVTRLQNNALADREFMSPGQIRCAEVLLAKTMPNLQSVEAKVDTQQSNVLRAPEPLANDQWEAKYGAKKPN
jgi:hypothetical protein